MFKIEKRFLEWVEKYILLFCVIGVTLISMIIRYSFREIISNDAYWCLLPWYDVIKEMVGYMHLVVRWAIITCSISLSLQFSPIFQLNH